MITTEISSDLVRGAIELEVTPEGVQPHRLPAWARARSTDPQLAMAEAQPAGVRLAFRTSATRIELDTVRTRLGFRGGSPRPDGTYDLVVDGQRVDEAPGTAGHVLWVDPAGGGSELERGEVGTVAFDGLDPHDKTVEVWLPWNEPTVLVALRTDEPVAPLDGTGRRTWLHHGSSISQGSNAAGPTATWVAATARAAGVDLVNLGFSGSALLDPFVARAMGEVEADLISVKIGINVVNADLMRRRAFAPAVHGFLDAIRDGHPDAPLAVLTPFACPIHESTPGPGAVDPEALAAGTVRFMATGDPAEVPAGRLTLEVVRTELAAVVAQRAASDPHLHLVDGLGLYGPQDEQTHPLPDALHPDAATHELIAERATPRLFGPDGPFR